MRDSKGRFGKGNNFAGGRPIGSLGALNKEMIKRVQAQGDKGRYVDDALFDIGFDTDVDVNVRLKALNKLADLLYSKAGYVEETKTDSMNKDEIDSRLKELLSRNF